MSPKCGPSGFRPRVGLRPNTPQHAAGMRMEPPASFPWAMATMPEATAAPAPPLEPPGVRVVSHGLRVGPNLTGSVVAPIAISGRFVFPMAINPARFHRLTSSASSSGTKSPMKFEDSVNRTPAYSARKSLTRNGTPENGPSGMGREAASRASSYIGVMTALRAGLSRSTRSIAASTSSAAVTSPLRTISAWVVASTNPSSSVIGIEYPPAASSLR